MDNKKTDSAVITLTIVLAMITASVLNSGYITALAKDKGSSDSNNKDYGSGSSSDSGSSPGSNNGGNSGSGSSDKATTSMGMDEKTGRRINDNGDMSKSIVVTNPTPQKPIIPTSPTEPGNPDMKCAVILSLGSNCKPEQHPQQPPGEGPDHDCLIHPELTKCKSDNGRCPDGFNQNEDGDCFAKHDKCPSGFHSHEDDETGRCN